MFDAVRNNPRFVQIFLALVTIPFALFGVDAYFRNAGGRAGSVAKVGAQEISAPELDRSMRDQENRLRAQLGESFDKSMIETPEFKTAVLDRLINERALSQAIAESRLQVPDAFVRDFIKSLPQFQDNGRFSNERYEAIVRNEGLSPQGYEDRVRVSLAQQMLLGPLVESAIASKSVSQRWIAMSDEERTVSEWQLQGAKFTTNVKLSDDTVKKYYDAHAERFRVPEQAKIEYVVLNSGDLAGQTQVSDADVKKWYDEHQDRFQLGEERRVRHILIQAGKDVSSADKQAARKKAEDLLAKVKSDPSKFGALAKENSDDKVSAEQGGDLGFFGKGAMVKAFEDAAFTLKPNEISGIVETEFGYHILQLTEVKPGKVKSLEEVRGEITDEIKKQAVNKRFGELAEQFGNMVYEQPDALKPVADKFGLQLKQTSWVVRGVQTGTDLDNPKVQTALFSSDSIKGRRNTEAIDLGNGKLLSARVVDYQATSVKPFESVKGEVERLVVAEEAAKLAKTQGEGDLAKLKAGEAVASATWSPPTNLKRGSNMSDAVRKAIFGASTKSLPAYVGVPSNDGYSIIRIEKVSEQKLAENDPRVKDVGIQYGRALGQEDVRAYISAVRERLGVKIFEDKTKP